MAKVRLNPLSSNEKEVEHFQGDNLQNIFDRAIEELLILNEASQYLEIFVNGYKIDRDFWKYTKAKEGTEILIASVPKGGDFGQTFKQIAIIAIAVTASAMFPPAAGVSYALIGAAITIGGVLLLNALIPPPSPGGMGLGAYGGQSDSQMYSIAGQSNSARRYGYVPKVYGVHRMFSNIAANPYTELETDPSTGNLVQFYYGIYDFGFGPANLRELKIGDTPIDDFSDISYRLVDLNKPETSEGEWDDVTFNNFLFYKGDVEQDAVQVVINGDKSKGADVDEYQVLRDASPLGSGDKQEITVNLVCPKGLTAYGTDGSQSSANIEMSLSVAEVGTEDWKAFSFEGFSESHDVVGGTDKGLYSSPASAVDYIFIPTTGLFEYYTLLSNVRHYSHQVINRPWLHIDPDPILPSEGTYTYYYRTWGIPKGSTSIRLLTEFNIDDFVYVHSTRVGRVKAKTSVGGGVFEYELYAPLDAAIVLFGGYSIRRHSGEWYFYYPYMRYKLDIHRNQHTTFVRKIDSSGVFVITGNSTNPIYSTVKFTPIDSGKNYKLKIERLRSYSANSYQVLNDLSVTNVVTRFDRSPIITDKRHLFLELRIRATNQINGTVQNLSGVVGSVLDAWDGVNNIWVKKETSNPAWVFCDLLTGDLNRAKVSKDRLNIPSLVEWAEYADEVPLSPAEIDFEAERFQCNFVLDFQTTLQSIINQVTSAAQASLNIIDGKYGVLIDKKKTIPVQILTPRNSFNFSSSKTYFDPPHALKIRYVDEGSSWEVIDKIVYDDGYSEQNAEKFEDMDAFGCTGPEQAWRFGRYMIAQARLRQETISIGVDFEHLVCTRGDYVKITQDVMRVGGLPARIKSINGNEVTIDDKIIYQAGIDYGYTYRSKYGQISTDTLTITSPDTATLNGPIPEVGDIIIWGEVGKITYDCIVKSIEPNNDLTARLVLVEKADAIYDAESTGEIPLYSPQISLTKDSDLVAPGPVENLSVADVSYECTGSGYEYFINLIWDIPFGSVFETFEIYADNGAGYKLNGFSSDTNYKYIVLEENLGIEHKFKVLAVSSNGKKLEISDIEVQDTFATPIKKTTPPGNVEDVYLNITGEILQIDWPAVQECDILEYLVRYSPTLSGTWVSSIPLLRTDRRTTLASVQARTGTYLIKAVDFNGNESDIEAIAITSIPNLFDLNVIEETNDFPLLPGSLNQVIKDGNALVLDKMVSGGVATNEYYSHGFYYFENFLDLGEIYTVRLQSLIEAEGFTENDIMANWPTLESVIALANSKHSEWDVETYYRSTDVFSSMSTWPTMDVINPINEGFQDLWTNWRKFTIGDFTGRIFQFRLKLISNKPSVTPRVFDGKIKADMPDRIESFDNLTAPIAGYGVVYSVPFKGPGASPAVQITQDDASQGDYYKVTDKTLSGFTINFYDKNDAAASRQFDVMVKGFGRLNNEVI